MELHRVEKHPSKERYPLKVTHELTKKVSELKDQGKSFREIGRELDLDPRTAQKAYMMGLPPKAEASTPDPAGTPGDPPDQETARQEVFRGIEAQKTLVDIVIEGGFDPEFVKACWDEWIDLKAIDHHRGAILESIKELPLRLDDLIGLAEDLEAEIMFAGYEKFFDWLTCDDCKLTYPAPRFLHTWSCPGCKTKYGWKCPQYVDDDREPTVLDPFEAQE